MKTPLAWLNLLHDKTRTIVAIAGVAFAVILVLMQLGFFFSVVATATQTLDQLKFDLVLLSPRYFFFSKPDRIPRTRLYEAAALPEIARVDPFYLGFNMWLKEDPDPAKRLRRGLLVLAFNPDDDIFKLPEISSRRRDLIAPRTVLTDRRSRPEFGRMGPGTETEVGDVRVKVIGQFTLGAGFGADGLLVTSDQTFYQLIPAFPANAVSMGLVELRPGANPDAVKAQLQKLLPQDVQVMTRADLDWYEQVHWVVKTSVGVIFGLGVIVALLVGMAIVYQVLASDINNHLPEYATLKAMGYSPRYLTNVILQQALILAVAGFLPGLVTSWVLYQITSNVAHVTMYLGPGLAISVFILSVLMCSVSGLASLRKVNSADPADLY
jgi:putative ABC transport system permease protein